MALIAAATLLWAFDFEQIGQIDENQVKDWGRKAMPLSPGEFGWALKPRGQSVIEALRTLPEEDL